MFEASLIYIAGSRTDRATEWIHSILKTQTQNLRTLNIVAQSTHNLMFVNLGIGLVPSGKESCRATSVSLDPLFTSMGKVRTRTGQPWEESLG